MTSMNLNYSVKSINEKFVIGLIKLQFIVPFLKQSDSN